jgi:polyisoprenoid-binding protein YceI
MQSPPGQADAPELQALLRNGNRAGDWALDPESSSIRLRSKAVGVIPGDGQFREITGQGTDSRDGAVSGGITITAASIDTNNARRDAHLRSADFFDSHDNPHITFAADSIRPSARGVTAAGLLDIRGTRRPLAFEAAAQVRGDSEVQLDAQVPVNRGDFGITWNPLGLLSMTTTLTVHAVFTRP